MQKLGTKFSNLLKYLEPFKELQAEKSVKEMEKFLQKPNSFNK